MKVILTEKVPSVGNVGEIVNVGPGHARNYLIPNKLAVLADDRNQKQLEDQKKRLASKMDAEKKTAEGLKKKLDGLKAIKFEKRVAGNGKLFGTINSSAISKALAEKNFEIEKRIISIPVPVKTVGDFDVIVNLFKDVEAKLTVSVSMDPAQVEEIKARQEAAAKKKARKAIEEANATAEGEEASEEAGEEAATEEA